jgi:hypothetical protein
MKRTLTLLFLLIFFTVSQGAILPEPAKPAPAGTAIIPADALTSFSKLKMKEVEKLLGRKLTFKEKVAVKIYQWKLRKNIPAKFRKGDADKGKTAMIFGIAGLVFLFLPVPYLGGLGAIISIIMALVLGYQAKKANPNDKKAKTAIILGWIGVGVIIAAIILLVAILSSWSGGWG